MALYTFVGILCSFIAVDITKSLISKKSSGFLYFLNLLAVTFLSIILANLLGFIWLSIYSELFIKAWFPELHHFGQMFIAFFGSSIWMSIFFVPLFHYMHIKNKVQYKKWIYSAFLIIVIAIPLMTVIQNGKSGEDNSTSANNKSSKYNFERVSYICHTGFDGVYLALGVRPTYISMNQYIYLEKNSRHEKIKVPILDTPWIEDNLHFKTDNQNMVNFISAENIENEISFKLEHIKENIFYEFKNTFMQTEGRCVIIDLDAINELDKAQQKKILSPGYVRVDYEAKYFEIAKFLKSQGVANQ